MRPAYRLKPFYDEMEYLHRKHFQDWRFGQLMSNFFGWIVTEKGKDCFYIEENEMMKLLKEFSGEVLI